MTFSTGYFASEKKPMHRTKIHIVFNGAPICKSNIDPLAGYYWCANGISIEQVECATCARILTESILCPHCGGIVCERKEKTNAS